MYVVESWLIYLFSTMRAMRRKKENNEEEEVNDVSFRCCWFIRSFTVELLATLVYFKKTKGKQQKKAISSSCRGNWERKGKAVLYTVVIATGYYGDREEIDVKDRDRAEVRTPSSNPSVRSI
eukprot:gene2103-1281_t